MVSVRRLIVAATLIGVIASCGDDDSRSIDSVTTEWTPPALEWVACGTNLSCATLVVPLDYEKPDLGTFELPVKRYRSPQQTDRIGSLVVNPGGPGSGGTYLAESAETVYSDELRSRFDIVGWDPRGTGGSNPAVDCLDDLDTYFSLDPAPDDEPETRTLLDGARAFAEACATRSSGALPYVSTDDSARDIDSLRRALGEETMTYFGFSYGSELGATWASLYPETVRAAVLDAAVDPTLTYADALVDQAASFEFVLDAFFDHCNTSRCVFMRDGETAEAAFDRIATSIDRQPLPTYEDRVAAGPGVFQTAVALTMYGEGWWGSLAEALLAADAGDGGPLLDLYDTYFGEHLDGRTVGNDIEAYFAISCLDRPAGFADSDVNERRTELDRVATRLGAGWFQEMLICANWPVSAQPRLPVATTAGSRILVVGSTGDAATPLTGTRAMARALAGSFLLVVDANDHTSYGGSDCATALIDEFLLGQSPTTQESNC